MNGYVEREGQKFLWLGKRSQAKSTFPGMLDHLVAGGLVSSYFHFAGFPVLSNTNMVPI